MRIKYLAQGNNILLPGFEPSTSVSKTDILANRPICSILSAYLNAVVYNACFLNAALSNAVCLYNAFLLLIFANAFCFHTLSWFIDTVCLFQVLFCTMHSAFNMMVFSKFYVHTIFYLFMKGLCALWRNST